MDTWLGPMLFADLSSGQVKIYGTGNGKVGYVSGADVAKVAVNAAMTPAARNSTITFTGPEAVTQREVVKIFELAAGKPLAVTEVPESALEAQWLGATDPFQKTFAGLMLGLARLDDVARSSEYSPATMLTVRDFAARRVAEG